MHCKAKRGNAHHDHDVKRGNALTVEKTSAAGGVKDYVNGQSRCLILRCRLRFAIDSLLAFFLRGLLR